MKQSKLQIILEEFKGFYNKFEDVKSLLDLAHEEQDSKLLQEVVQDVNVLHSTIETYFSKSLLTDPMDKNDCFIEIRAGSGGTESQDWVQILTRMYERWSQHQGYQATLVDFDKGDVAGYKSSTIQVKGVYAFGWAKYEGGVHRFVRCSPFDSNGKRHTSFVSVQVLPFVHEKEDGPVELNPNELKIEVMRAQGYL
jgi:peptide chain release factor 2